MSSTEALVNWIRSRGGFVHAKLDLFHQLPNGDRGVVALEDIKEGEQLVLVPADCTLHIPTETELKELADMMPQAAAYLATKPEVSPFISTVMLLMAEIAKGNESTWGPYIGALPESCDCLLSWDDADKAHLKGTSIEDVTGGNATEAAFQREVAPHLKAQPGLWPSETCNFKEFCRVAGLVQSRAFHMVAENWITGETKESAELFLIPGIDMINHASNPDRRNSSLFKFNSSMKVEVDGKQVEFRGFFTMKAEKDIAAGQQVFHTYGDLSDSQLLQTYGFIDMPPEPSHKSKKAHKASAKKGKGKGEGKKGDQEGGDEGEEHEQPFGNPHNHTLIPFKALLDTTKTILVEALGVALEPAAAKALEEEKIRLLTEGGLLQSALPLETQFVVSASKPLSDELLTATQVLLMMDEELEQLEDMMKGEEGQEEDSDDDDDDEEEEEDDKKKKKKSKKKAAPPAKKKSGDKAGGSAAKPATEGAAMCGLSSASLTSAAAAAPAAAALTAGSKDAAMKARKGAAGSSSSSNGNARKAPLNLGLDLMEEDLEFAEFVSLTVIQTVDDCMKRYPSDPKTDAKLIHKIERQLKGEGDAKVEEGDKKVTKKQKTGKTGAKSTATESGPLSEEDKVHLQRQYLSLMVRQSERSVLSLTKRDAALMVLKIQAALAEAGEGEYDDEDEGGEGEEGEEVDFEQLDEEDKKLLAKLYAARSGDDSDDEDDEDEDGLLNSDDSDKVGYGSYEFDDGIGEEHDRCKPHPAPKD